MKLIKVGAAVLNQTALDWDGNRDRILQSIELARQEQVSLLCLPELAISGYGCEDAFHSPSVHRCAWEVLQEILPSTRGMAVAVGLPVFFRHSTYNAACLMADGAIVGFTAKQNLAGDGVHYEPRFFKAWPSDCRAELRVGEEKYPIGDLVYEFGDVRVGFEICEDAWVSNRPGADLASLGVDLILNPSASHFAFGKQSIRERFVQEGSRAFGVSYIYANLVGNDAGRVIFDGGALIASQGRLVASGTRLGFQEVDLTTAVVDVGNTRMNRARLSSFRPAIEEPCRLAVESPFRFPVHMPEHGVRAVAGWESSSLFKEEEFTRAEALGLFDYMRKSWSRGFVVSLSGGVDSAAVALLVHVMVRLGVAELGREGFLARMPHVQAPAALPDPEEDLRQLTGMLLTCAYQATRNSSATTHDAALGLASAVGAVFHDLDVETLVQGYTGMIEGALGRPLTWAQDDLALQNIQARVRAPGVWMLANIRGALLLSTSNRSEAAVGYATMDGDTSGGLSPIAGIDKAFLRRWLCTMEKGGLEGIPAFPSLAAINCQAPTAELRPSERKQTDEEDLMPYDVLDVIERLAIRDKLSPLEIWRWLRLNFQDHRPKQLQTWTERFFRLWCRNQWKRERYAPSFHLDDENLDPKTWCRFPILSGGYQRELAALAQQVEKECGTDVSS